MYTTLDRLERDGLVTSDEADGQKRYRITAGRSRGARRLVDDLARRRPAAARRARAQGAAAIEDGPDHALEVITRSAPRSPGSCSSTAGRRGRPPTTDLAAALVADALVARAEADLRWLDPCEARILRARTTTLPTTNGDTHG